MFAQFARWFKPSATTTQAHALYIALVRQARQPFFYTHAGVPDTVDGRFDQILLHCFLLTHRLRQEPDHPEAARTAAAITDRFFDDMDRSLREMGVGDMSVGKKIKKMADALNGRFVTYEKALADKEELAFAITRNVYGTAQADADKVSQLADYVLSTHEALARQSVDSLLQGQIIWQKF